MQRASICNSIKCFNPSQDDSNSRIKQQLFHYTSPIGLYSILKSRSIRFTDCQFLNDKTEYNHIHEPLKIALEEAYYSLHDKTVIEAINNNLDDNFDFNTLVPNSKFGSTSTFSLGLKRLKKRYFVFCASESPDSLGMWNYYVRNGGYQGYNFQLSLSCLLESFSQITSPDVDIFYGKVIYKESEKVSILKNLILSEDEKLHKSLLSIKDPQSIDFANEGALEDLITFLNDYRLFFKDTAFSSEKEYRFVLRIPADYTEQSELPPILEMAFEPRNGVVTPFCVLHLQNNDVIKGITLSPMLEREIAEIGLRRYLKSLDYSEDIYIRPSQIPIRF